MPSSKQLPPTTSPFFPNHFIKNQFLTRTKPLPKSLDLAGKVAIVTGSNCGLGLESAAQLLQHGLSMLIMAVRSIPKGDIAADGLRRNYPAASINVWQLDMSLYNSIQAFVTRVNGELDRVDIAILNAGLGFGNFTILPTTGHEETVQINYLSTMFLATLLLPVLKAKSPVGSPGRLTISTAMLSIAAKFPNKNEIPLLPSFDDPKWFETRDVYSTSKLLGQMFVWKLTDKVSANDVVVNLVEPGFIKGTELHADASPAGKIAMAIFKAATARNVTVGASTYLDAAIVKGKESHGCVLTNWEIAPYAPFQYTEKGKEVMDRLWKETIAEFKFADVENIISSL